MILTAYYDESGTHSGSLATVLAGIVGKTHDVVDLEIEWAKVLKKHNLTHVRAKQLFHRQGQFKKWSDEQAQELWAGLMYVVQERKEMFISKSVLREDEYKQFYVSDGPAKKERLDTRYALCFRAFLHFLPAIQTGAMAVNFVLEAGHKNAGDALRVFNELKADKQFRWRHSIGALSFGNKQESPALQLADMLAYVSYREKCQAIEDGYWKSLTDFDFELIRDCGLTVLEHPIAPEDMMTMRQNFMRKHKRPVFGRALFDARYEIEPTSYEAQFAGIRTPMGR